MTKLQVTKSKLLENDHLDDNDDKVKEVENKIREALLEKQCTQMEKELQQVEKVKKKGKSASIFNLKEKVLGGKKQNQEATSIIDPKTKKRLFDHEEIKPLYNMFAIC